MILGEVLALVKCIQAPPGGLGCLSENIGDPAETEHMHVSPSGFPILASIKRVYATFRNYKIMYNLF